jgi:hypothetical protein
MEKLITLSRDNHLEMQKSTIIEEKLKVTLTGEQRFHLAHRIHVWRSVKDTYDRDAFIGHFTEAELRSPFFRANSLSVFTTNTRYKTLFAALQQTGLHVLIGGSSPLRFLCSWAEYRPSDIDIYTKQINRDKVLLIDRAIRLAYPGTDIVLVRTSLTLSWMIWNLKQGIIIETIQLSLMRIETSWSELFVVIHSDFLCLAFELSELRFIYMKGRFEHCVTAYQEQSTAYFCNIFNCDTKLTLERASQKYGHRGFLSEMLYIEEAVDIDTLTSELAVEIAQVKAITLQISISDERRKPKEKHQQTGKKERRASAYLYLLCQYRTLAGIAFNWNIELIYPADNVIPPILEKRWLVQKYPDWFQQLFAIAGSKDSTVWVSNRNCEHRSTMQECLHAPVQKTDQHKFMQYCPLCQACWSPHPISPPE